MQNSKKIEENIQLKNFKLIKWKWICVVFITILKNCVNIIKKDLKTKLTKADFEVPEGDEKERWLTNLYFETATMVDEGLLVHESSHKKWEIAQKGIDYLSKYAK